MSEEVNEPNIVPELEEVESSEDEVDAEPEEEPEEPIACQSMGIDDWSEL